MYTYNMKLCGDATFYFKAIRNFACLYLNLHTQDHVDNEINYLLNLWIDSVM